MYAIVKKE